MTDTLTYPDPELITAVTSFNIQAYCNPLQPSPTEADHLSDAYSRVGSWPQPQILG